MSQKPDDRCMIKVSGYDSDGDYVHHYTRMNQNIDDIQQFVALFRKQFPHARKIVITAEFMDYIMQRGEPGNGETI